MGGAVMFEPFLGVVDFAPLGWFIAAGVLAVAVAGDDRSGLTGGEDPFLASGV